MKFTINVGADRSPAQVQADAFKGDVLGYVHWREVRAALRAVGFLVAKHSTLIALGASPEDQEDTHIVELDVSRIPPGEVYSRIWSVAYALHQDCIAVRVRDDSYRDPHPVVHEVLVGPCADKWAPFNPAYFKELPC
jgi:hypothetical protein